MLLPSTFSNAEAFNAKNSNAEASDAEVSTLGRPAKEPSVGVVEPRGASRKTVAAYPQLQRLCQDFGLKVSSAPDGGAQPGRRLFGLAEQQVEGSRYLTPVFPTLSELERFVVDNMVDILHSYFFGEPAEAQF